MTTVFKKLRWLFETLEIAKNHRGFGSVDVRVKGQEASDLIKAYLEDSAPCMIARFGSVELLATLNYQNRNNYKNLSTIFQYLVGGVPFLKLDEELLNNLVKNAGFFPYDLQLIDKYSELVQKDLGYLDILGSWIKEEYYFKSEITNIVKIPLEDLEPYYHSNPWSKVLEGKKILVIHPFSDSIKQQYLTRDKIFDNPDVLPKFELHTLKAVQSMAGNETDFKNWFEALDFMKHQIEVADFDIAIIGCGAYGFHLAAHIKRIGKKAIHLGGATQILFGIKGRRWNDMPKVTKLYNNYWHYPLPDEYPSNFKQVENGCYWG